MNRVRINRIITVLIAAVSLISCGSSKSGKKSMGDSQLGRAMKNIITSESIEDINRKKLLLNNALNIISRAEAAGKKKKKTSYQVYAGYALYYYASGDYGRAEQNSAKAISLNGKDPFVRALDARIKLKQKGKAYARDAINILQQAVKTSPEMAIGHFTLGDSYLSLLNLNEAKKSYKRVLAIRKDFQIHAADRLETINQIEKVGIEPLKFKNVIFSKTIKRGELADILNRVFNIRKKFRLKKKVKMKFTDLTGTEGALYSTSIKILRKSGFFTYIKGNKFEPLKVITRREFARVIEDYIVLSSGNIDFRKRYSAGAKSPIKDIDSKDPYYNAVRVAVKQGLINLTLEGLMKPDDPMESIDTLISIRKMINKK